MIWWVVLAVVVIAVVLLLVRGRAKSGRSRGVDDAAVARTRNDGQYRGNSSPGGFNTGGGGNPG